MKNPISATSLFAAAATTLLSLTGALAAAPRLQFRADGTFKIVHFTDFHFYDDGDLDASSLKVMETVLMLERPDFAVLSGDVVDGTGISPTTSGAKFYRYEYNKIASVLTKYGVPWALTLGNHDTGGPLTREEIVAVDQSFNNSMTQRGPATATGGVTNYYLPIYARDGASVAYLLWMLDVSEGLAGGCEGYPGDDCVTRDIVEWYANTSAAINKGRETPIDAFMFTHIPVPEFVDLWNNERCLGSKGENICCPQYNTGLFDAIVKTGDVRGLFVGHDHVNDFCGTFEKHPNVTLCYGRKSGYGEYNPEKHGARIIQLRADRPGAKVSWETWIRDELGEVPVLEWHEPTGPGQLHCGAAGVEHKRKVLLH